MEGLLPSFPIYQDRGDTAKSMVGILPDDGTLLPVSASVRLVMKLSKLKIVKIRAL